MFRYELHFLWGMQRCFLPAAFFFSGSRLRITRGARVYTTDKRGSRAGSVARSLGVQSRAILQVATGSYYAEPESSRTTEIHTEQAAAGGYMLSAVHNSSHLAWPLGHLEPRAWSPDLLTTSHLGPSHVQLQSRFELVSSSHRVFVCVYTRTSNEKISQTAVPLVLLR